MTEIFRAEQYAGLKVAQIFCLDSGQVQNKEDNLDTVRYALCSYFALKNYYACYYYGNINERFGHAQFLPNIMVTEDAAIQFTTDGSQALIHTDTETLGVFRTLLEKLEASCRPIAICIPNLLDGIRWNRDYVKKESFQKTYEICSGICSIPFWNRELILRYLHPAIPDYNRLVEVLCAHAADLKKKEKNGHIVLLMNPFFVEEFVRTGVWREYPSNFIKKPLTIQDRRYLLEEMLTACEEGWYEIRFIEEAKFPLDHCWEIVASERQTLIQYFHENTFRIFELSELSCSGAIYDYMKILGNGRHAMSEENAEKLVKRWIDKYLST